jgi:hypothetical protein
MLPGCRSAWKKPVAKHLVEESLRRLAQQRADIVPGGDQRGAVVDPMPPMRSVVSTRVRCAANRPRHVKCRIAGEILGELRGRRRLEPQIHLDLDRLGQGAHDLDRLQPAQRRARPLDQARQPHQELEIAGEGAQRFPAAVS